MDAKPTVCEIRPITKLLGSPNYRDLSGLLLAFLQSIIYGPRGHSR